MKFNEVKIKRDLEKEKRDSTRQKVHKKFKLRGYILKSETLTDILAFVEQFQDAEDEALDLLLDELELHTKSMKSSILERELVSNVIGRLLDAADSGDCVAAEVPLRLIDAFSGFGSDEKTCAFPKFHYDLIKKSFIEHQGSIPIHGDASAKATLYRDRFILLFQRVSRDPYFSKSAFDSGSGSSNICSIQSLLGRSGRSWVMGLISQLEDGHFYLEDLTAAVEINFSDAKITTGFFSENTIILADGEMVDGVFQVKNCGFPPLEDKDKSVAAFSGADFFGGGALSKEETLRLKDLEASTERVNDLFVILSDIWVDNEEVMRKLETILDHYENGEVVPFLFVFMGNFCSQPCNLSFKSFSTLRTQFEKLGQVIGAHQRLKDRSTFIFIPGPEDAGPSTAIPRCSLLKCVTEELQKHVTNAIFLSNPCRYYSQEIVFFRQNLLYKMRRSCLIPLSTEETSDPFEHLVATIIHQSHLCPIPLNVQPIIWNYDHCFHLYPAPDTIVLGDSSEQKAFHYIGTTCLNPGSFSTDGTYAEYQPNIKKVNMLAC